MEWTIKECIDYCHDKQLIGEVNHANLINQLEDFEKLDLEKESFDFDLNNLKLVLDYFKARNIIEPSNRYVDKCLNIMKNFLKEVSKCH